MSYLAAEVFDLPAECACGWSGAIALYRQHLVREHCNVEDCAAPAAARVSFGFRQPAFVLIGARLGICERHRASLRRGQMHMLVEDVAARATGG